MLSVVQQLHDEWRATEAEARAAEDELHAQLCGPGTAPPELIQRVRALRAESATAFKGFLHEAERTAVALNWSRVSDR
jgi:hypothetical protein